MKTRATLLFVILSLLATPTFAADFKKGIGSGWFKMGHQYWGSQKGATASNPPPERQLELHVADIRRFKKAGFDHVRLHFHLAPLIFWKECIGYKGGPYANKVYGVKCYGKNLAKQKKAKWKTKQRFFIDNKVYLNDFIDAVKLITDKDMDVIIVPWGAYTPSGSVYTLTDAALHDDAAFRTLYVKFYSHLVRRVRKEVKNWRRVAFQTYNEPFFCDDTKPQLNKWRSVEKRVIRAIRKQIPTSTVLVSAVCTSGDFFFTNADEHPKVRVAQVMAPYKQFKNLIYTIHFRQPRVFVFQTIMQPDVTGLKYPMKRGNVSSVMSKADSSKSELENYRDNKWNRTVLFDAIRQAADWKSKHGVRLHITEWGPTRSNVDGKGGGPDRRGQLLYARDMVDAMKKYGITWTYASWLEWDGITNKYIVSNEAYIRKNRLLDPALMKRLMR